MLEVVEQQQHMLVTEIVQQLPLGRVMAGQHHPYRIGDSTDDGAGNFLPRLNRLQVNKPGAVRKRLLGILGQLNRQPGFAAAADPHQRQQAAVGVLEDLSRFA